MQKILWLKKMTNIIKGVYITVCEGRCMIVGEEICSKDWQKQILNKAARTKIIKKHSLI